MKVPPYGKPLKNLVDSSQLPHNNVYLYIGSLAWDKGKSSSISRPDRTLVLSPEKSPLLYDWPVHGCDILMIETSPVDTGYIENLVDILFIHGAIKIMLISVNFLTTIYERDF